ncbi:MAG: VOC family protein, partial [Actinomycetota bacterium]
MSGDPSYIELGVPDATRARAFYEGLLGWRFGEAPAQAGTGTLSVGLHGGDDASLFEVFFTVADLDDALDRVRVLGGSVLGEVRSSEGFGRWAEC